MRAVRPGAAALVLLSLTLLLPGSCAGGSSDSGTAGPVSHEYLPGLEAYPHLPTGVTSAPVVVLVPGGGWVSADPSGLGGLADSLASIQALRAAGLDPVPHIAARRIASRAELETFLARAAVLKALVIGGDEREVRGPFADGAALIRSGTDPFMSRSLALLQQ